MKKTKEEITAELGKNAKHRRAMNEQQAFYIEELRRLRARPCTSNENKAAVELRGFCKRRVLKLSEKINDLNVRDHVLEDMLRRASGVGQEVQ